MRNNDSFFHITGPVSNQAEKVYPAEVHPFAHAGVIMFSHEEHAESWCVTECQTGTLIGRGADQEAAEVQARDIINAHIEIKGIIGYIADMIEAGFEYDSDAKEWNAIEPVEEDTDAQL